MVACAPIHSGHSCNSGSQPWLCGSAGSSGCARCGWSACHHAGRFNALGVLSVFRIQFAQCFTDLRFFSGFHADCFRCSWVCPVLPHSGRFLWECPVLFQGCACRSCWSWRSGGTDCTWMLVGSGSRSLPVDEAGGPAGKCIRSGCYAKKTEGIAFRSCGALPGCGWGLSGLDQNRSRQLGSSTRMI